MNRLDPSEATDKFLQVGKSPQDSIKLKNMCAYFARNEKSRNLSLPPDVCLPTQQVVLVAERIPLKNEEGQTSKKEFETKLLVGNPNK